MKVTFFLLPLLWLLVSCGSNTANTSHQSIETVKSQWITNTFETLTSSNYPKIKAISWWHENWENEDGTYSLLRLDSSNAATLAYQKGVSNSIFTTVAQFHNSKLIETDGIYHAAFPDFGGEEENVTLTAISQFEALANKKIVWAYFSNNWLHGIHFPKEEALRIKDSGKIPFIRMMPRSQFKEYVAEKTFTLQHIVDGTFDTELTAWAQDAKAFRAPLLVEFGTEVNGEWFAWNGIYNGKEAGGTIFQRAYRHIIDLFREVGVSNITWFFHVNAYSYPETAWNTIARYYPGDDYIDWIGVSIYGGLETNEPYQEFEEILDDVYPKLIALAPTKPIAILEFSITEY